MLSVVLKSIPLLFLLMFIVVLAHSNPAQLPVLNAEASGKVENGEERGLRGAQVSMICRGEEG